MIFFLENNLPLVYCFKLHNLIKMVYERTEIQHSDVVYNEAGYKEIREHILSLFPNALS